MSLFTDGIYPHREGSTPACWVPGDFRARTKLFQDFQYSLVDLGNSSEFNRQPRPPGGNARFEAALVLLADPILADAKACGLSECRSSARNSPGDPMLGDELYLPVVVVDDDCIT